mgnify:CR=1 FL=1
MPTTPSIGQNIKTRRLQRSWSILKNLQVEDRAHRIGSELHDQIDIIDIIAEGTIDRQIQRAISKKQNLVDVILEGKEVL